VDSKGATSAAAKPPKRTKPAATAVARAPERARPAALLSPREACGERTQFSLYRCMQTECERPAFLHHPQCERLRSTDSVD
jgi:non-specific serine/threonine protein kinase